MFATDIDFDKFRTEFNIDKKNHPDSEVIDFCGKKRTLGEIRKVYNNFNERRYNLLSFYDDIFQYTSLGLIDIILDIYNIDEKIPFESYFKRTETNSLDFVYNFFKGDLSKEIISDIEKEYYEEILLRSPFSKNAQRLYKIRSILESQLMVFKYKFKGLDIYKRKIIETYGKDEYISFEVDFLNGRTENKYINDLPKIKEKFTDIVIINDASSFVDYMDKKEINDSIILTSLDHCGLTKEEQYTYEIVLQGVGPRNSRIFYIEEGI